MIVYLDLIIINNFLINYISLFFIEKVFSDKINYCKLIISSLLGSLFVISIFINEYLYFILKLLGGLIIVEVGIKSVPFSKQIIKISLFYTLNFAFVGFLNTFGISNNLLSFLAFGVILGLSLIETNKKYFVFLNRYKYRISITIFDKKYYLDGFLDNGNECLCDGFPVMFFNKKIISDVELSSYEIYMIMDILTVNGYYKQNVYKPQDFTIFINNKEYHKDVLVIFSNINKDCLINPYILI